MSNHQSNDTKNRVIRSCMPNNNVIHEIKSINTEVVKLYIGNKDAKVKEIYESFKEYAGVTQNEITRARDEDDYAKIIEIMHRLKSSSKAIGAISLYDLCLDVERDYSQNQNSNIECRIDLIQVEICSVIYEIEWIVNNL